MRKKKNSDLSYHKSDIFYIRLRQYDTFSLQFFDRVLKSQEIKAMLMIACDKIKDITFFKENMNEEDLLHNAVTSDECRNAILSIRHQQSGSGKNALPSAFIDCDECLPLSWVAQTLQCRSGHDQ
jgi:hypothetical protein